MDSYIMHQFHGVDIGIEKEAGYLNITKVCKAYKIASGKQKRPDHWLATSRAQESIEHLSAVTGIAVTDLIKKVQGGTPEAQGTWIHPKLAIAFGSWLSVEFELAIQDWFDEWHQARLTGKFPASLTGSAVVDPIEQSVKITSLMMDELFKNNAMKDSVKAEALAALHPEYRPALEAAKKFLAVPTKDRLLTPTELGQLFDEPKTPNAVNKMLLAEGLQTKTGDRKCPYLPAGRGHDHSELVADTAKGHGKTVQSLKWFESVMDLLT